SALQSSVCLPAASGAMADQQIRSAGLPLFLAETGSITGSSMEALTLGAALYDLKEMVVLAENGWLGVNFHGGDAYDHCPGYAPVYCNGDGTYSANSTLYAM